MFLHMNAVESSGLGRERAGGGLRTRFEAHLRASGVLPGGGSLILALSGGVDSIVLLDLLLGLRSDWNWRLRAAHFDHRMRAGSAADARWVGEHCERLGVPCRVGRADAAPRNESEARRLRYAFLRRVRDDQGGGLLITAHQADDQAETVLFRLLRGSGLAGLAGIPVRREPGIVRPFLPFSRSQIEAYARDRGLEYRSDPSNRSLRPRRNWLRHRVIPEIEADTEPNLRAQLVHLAGLAGRAGAAVEGQLEEAVEELIEEVSPDAIVVARPGFCAYDELTRAHLLRALIARVGPPPGRVGTRLALEFISRGHSGREIELAGGVRIRREFDRLRIARRDDTLVPDVDLALPNVASGTGRARIGGVSWRVRWALHPPRESGAGFEKVARFDPIELRFPLALRAWRPGDRIRTPAGTRKLKKLFVDRRVERSRRGSYPVLADQEGILWVVGLERGVRAVAEEWEPGLIVELGREG